MAIPDRLSRGLLKINGGEADVVVGTGSRVNASVASTSTSEAALPAGARAIEVRCTVDCYIRFGATGVGAAAADANSILFPAGEKLMVVPFSSGSTPSTHFRVIRGGSVDGALQIEEVAVQG